MATTSSAVHNYNSRPRSGWALWRGWVLATTLGELIGFLAPALAGVVVTRALMGMEGLAAPLLTFVVLVAAGSLEGAALGYAQWRVLRHAVPAIGWRAWTGATALAAVVAWIMGMLPNTLMDATGLGMGVLIVSWIVVAPVLLLTIGVGQWLVLRRHVARAALWIPANALAWTLGVGATFLGASLVTETMPLLLAVAIGLAGGVAMGLVVGCITGGALAYLLGQEGL